MVVSATTGIAWNALIDGMITFALPTLLRVLITPSGVARTGHGFPVEHALDVAQEAGY